MTYQKYLDNLREEQDNDRLAAEADNKPFNFDYYGDMEQFEMNCLAQEAYWDCLECSAPPEVLEDCPQ